MNVALREVVGWFPREEAEGQERGQVGHVKFCMHTTTASHKQQSNENASPCCIQMTLLGPLYLGQLTDDAPDWYRAMSRVEYG